MSKVNVSITNAITGAVAFKKPGTCISGPMVVVRLDEPLVSKEGIRIDYVCVTPDKLFKKTLNP